MGLDAKLNQIVNREQDKLFSNTGNKVSSKIANITTGLDIADNGLVKDLLGDLLGDLGNSIFKSDSLAKSPRIFNLLGSTNVGLATGTMDQFVRLSIIKEAVKPAGADDLTWIVSQNIETTTFLPFPQDITLDTSPQWESLNGGFVGEKLLEGRISDLGAAISLGKNLVGEEGQAQLKAVAINNTASASGGLLGVDDAGKFNDAAAGLLLNPREVVLFSGIAFRDFTVNFNISPQTKKQSDETALFLRDLHINATPDLDGAYFTYPAIFNFALMGKEGKVIMDRGEVVITNINCNYTPDGVWASFKNQQPVHIQLAISFKERILPTRKTFDRTLGFS